MRLAPSVFAFLTLQFLAGCAVEQGAMPFPTDGLPVESERVAYTWEKYRVDVSFHKSGTNDQWFMSVRDSWDVFDQSFQQDGKIWSTAESRCSTADGLRIIEQSLKRFLTTRPNAKLESVHVEMQLISNLWHDVLTGLATTLMKVNGTKGTSSREGPLELINGVRSILNESPTVAELKNLLRKYGVEVRYVGTSGQILFKDSLVGHAWADIAGRPDLGILAPGLVELGVQMEQAEQVGD